MSVVPGQEKFGKDAANASNTQVARVTVNRHHLSIDCVPYNRKLNAAGNHSPKNRTVFGYTAGLGILAIDPVGIRVIPEVRYTRWTADAFNSFSTISARNQLEAGISLSF